MPSRGGIGLCFKLIAGADSGLPTLFSPERVGWWNQFLARRWADLFNIIREYPEVFAVRAPQANAHAQNGRAPQFRIQGICFKRNVELPSLLQAWHVIKGRIQESGPIYYDLHVQRDVSPLQLLVWIIDHISSPGPMKEALVDLIGDYPIPDIDNDESVCREFAVMEKDPVVTRAAEIYLGRPKMVTPQYGLPYRPPRQSSPNGHASITIPWVPNTTNTF